MIQITDGYIFQVGWFNHQLENGFQMVKSQCWTVFVSMFSEKNYICFLFRKHITPENIGPMSVSDDQIAAKVMNYPHWWFFPPTKPPKKTNMAHK